MLPGSSVIQRTFFGDCRSILRGLHLIGGYTVQTCVTSPPYFGLRDYGHDGQIGLESTPDEYVAKMVEVFRCVRDVLADDGTVWLNLGDSYAGSANNGGTASKTMQGTQAETGKSRPSKRGNGLKPKDLIGIPWRVAFALQADGWYLSQDIIWHKPNPMPESVTDRCTKAHEYLFLLSKSERYYFDSKAMKEPAIGKTLHDISGTGYKAPGQARNSGNRKSLRSDVESRHRSQITGGQSLQADPDGMRNKRSVWTVPTKPYNGKKALTDYVGDDGKPYTASPDCPIHGHLSRKKTVGTHGYGGQQGQTQTGSVGTDSRHAASPACDEQSTTSHNSQASAACNSEQHTLESSRGSKTDSRLTERTSGARNLPCNGCNSKSGVHLDCEAGCSRQCSSSTATYHSNETSKTYLDHTTGRPCMPCAETDSRTQSTSDKHGLFWQDLGISESSTLTGGASVHPSQDTRSCNVGTSSELVLMAYEVGNKCTCNEVIIDHFATFPPALIEPCILAGSRPGDVVLDPFMGSGTTAQVAQHHGRQWIGCELNPEYEALQHERMGKTFK